MMTDEIWPYRTWCSRAMSWLTVRMIIAAALASTIFSWGYNYRYEVLEYPDLIVTPDQRLQDFLTTAIGYTLFGLIPALGAVLIQISGRRWSWHRTLLAATIPNAAFATAAALTNYLGGLGSLAVPLATIIATLGSVTFFLALALPPHPAPNGQ